MTTSIQNDRPPVAAALKLDEPISSRKFEVLYLVGELGSGSQAAERFFVTQLPLESVSAKATNQAVHSNLDGALLSEASIRADLDIGALCKIHVDTPDIFEGSGSSSRQVSGSLRLGRSCTTWC